MCGIVGQVRRRGSPVEPELLGADVRGARAPRARLRAASHGDGDVGLGIQRLRVIDLDDRRPADLQRGPLGRRRPQRRDLQLPRAARASSTRRGHTLRHRAATPRSIVHLYEEHGRRLRPHAARHVRLRALGQRRRQLLLLARDRVGKKPLFYAQRDGALSFASELAALLAATTEIPREVDHAALDCYLAYGYVPAPLDRLPRRAQAAAGAHADVCATAAAYAASATGSWTTRASSRSTSRRGAARADPRRRCAHGHAPAA